MFDQLKYNLRHNRRHVGKSVTAWLIFGAIILVFIFWGMTPRNQGVSSVGFAATVNDSTISTYEYREMVDRLQRDPRFAQLQSLGGAAGRQMLERQALNQLVERELANQATSREHIITSDAEVRDIITSIPQFNENGVFKRDRYRAYVDSTGKAPSQFEDEIRKDQSLRRASTLFGAALKPLKIESEKEKSLEALRANVEFVSVPTETIVIPETVPQADAKAFAADPANDAKIKDYYASHKADFSLPERVKVRHILIRSKAGDADAEKKALEKIEGIAQKAKKGDFAKIASEVSEDPGSKTKGGLIDFFSRGKMVKEFEDAAFTQPVGEVGQPVKTEYGYHLIQVLDKKPAINKTEADVREDVAAILIAKDRSKVAIEQLQEMLKKGDEAGVRKFVETHKLKWEESGPFSIQSDNVPKLGQNEEVVKTAFRLTPEKPLSDSLVREGGRAFIVRYKAAAPLKDDKKVDKLDMMAEMKANQRGEEALRKWLDELRKSSKISMNPQVLSAPAED